MEQKEIDKSAEEISSMTQHQMCRKWSFDGAGSLYFRGDLITSSGVSLGDLFKDRLFKHFGGLTPEISKDIGWI